jgi:hypothetical protein
MLTPAPLTRCARDALLETDFRRPSVDYIEAMNRAHADVMASDIPEGMRIAAFAVTLQARVSGDRRPTPQIPLDPTPVREDSPATEELARLARLLGTERTELEDVFEVEAGKVAVRVPSARLAVGKAAATRELAQLVASAAAATGDEWVPVDDIREVCAAYGKYDRPNFSTALRALGDLAAIRTRNGKTELRLTRPGREATAELVRRLATSAPTRQ